MNVIYLKPGREKSLKRRHPWVFSGAVARIDGEPEMGETVELRDSHGRFLATGAYSPESQIRVRVWSWDIKDAVDPELLYNRLAQAMELRVAVYGQAESADSVQAAQEPRLPSAVRLVHAESDGLPGLIVDRYGNTLVVQFLSAGAEYWRQTIVNLLLELTDAEYIFERSDAEVRKLEGLVTRIGPLYGEPPEQLAITENELRFVVSLVQGHKTGFYLDQRINRKKIREISHGKEVLDCFAYTGGFTLNALMGGAKSVTVVDSSKDALELCRENVALNRFPEENVEWLVADVFQQLRKFRDQARQFELIILDPPKFAPTTSQVQKATRAYKDINLLGLKLLRPGGSLITFSCSGGVDAALFQKIVAGAALDAGKTVHIVSHLDQGPDHPVALNFPEGSYLKGLHLRVAN